MSFNEELQVKLSRSGVVAVLVIDRAEDGVPLAKALLDGGVDCMELTLRTDAAIPALNEIIKRVPEMTAGIGTVLTVDQVDAVKAAGAAFAVAPGMNRRIVEKANSVGLPFAPGIMTPSDIEQAVECGCQILKFFPAESTGGLEHLKSMAAPYNHLGLKYIPLGGLNQENMKSYLEDSLVLSIGGSWIAKRDLIQKQDWKAITKNAQAASEVVKQVNA